MPVFLVKVVITWSVNQCCLQNESTELYLDISYTSSNLKSVFCWTDFFSTQRLQVSITLEMQCSYSNLAHIFKYLKDQVHVNVCCDVVSIPTLGYVWA